jgi:hypothetical protein
VTSAGTGPAEPYAARSSPRSRSATTASEQTAITIAFLGPTFMNVCGWRLGRSRTARTSSSSASAFRFGPTRNSASGSERTPRTLPSSTCASSMRSGGSASPAGDDVPRFPPIVPRLRICGEPTVRDASASAGRSSASGGCIASVYVRQAPSRTDPSSCAQLRSSGTSFRLRIAAGRARSKLSSTSRSVPPAMGRAAG